MAIVAAGLVLAPAALRAPGSVAEAAQSPTSPAFANDICDGSGAVHNDVPSPEAATYGRAWVENGETVTLNLNGLVTPSNWVGTWKASEQIDVWILGADGETEYKHWRAALVTSSYPSSAPVSWADGPSTWVNNNAEGSYLIKTAPYRGPLNGVINSGSEWTISVGVSGGADADGPDCLARENAESDVPNDAEPGACGAQPDDADPVNVVQGNFWQTWSDVTIPGRGQALDLSRTYSSSRASEDSTFGFGWSSSYGMSISTADGVARVRQETGAVAPFTQTSASWMAPRRVNATLVEDSASTTARWVFRRGGNEIFKFNDSGKLTSIEDLSGNATVLAYTGGLLQTVTDDANRVLTFSWNAAGTRITKVTAPSAQLTTAGSAQVMEVSYGYNTGGELTSVTETGTGVWTFGYDGSHRLTTIREPRHHALGAGAPVVENHYDANGRVDWQEDRLDRRTSFVYTATTTTVTRPKRQTSEPGDVTVYEHTGGICRAITRNPGANQSRWTFEVDPATLGRIKVTDPNLQVTTAEFNNRGLPTKVTSPQGQTTIVYDPVTMRPTSVTDPIETTTFVYEPGTDRLSSISRPITPGTGTWTTTLQYTDATNPGRPTVITDSRSMVWELAYDSYGNLASVEDPTHKSSSWTYNSHGWPVTSVTPKGADTGSPAFYTTSYEYNLAGDVLKVIEPAADASAAPAVTEYSVDPSGYLEWIKDPVLSGVEQTLIGRNAAGQVETVTRPGGSILRNEYWGDGSLRYQKDAATIATEYTYDEQGRVETVKDPAGRVTTYRYDFGGRLASRQQPGGDCIAASKTSCISYTYPQVNQVKVDYSDPATADTTLTFDGLGRRTTMVDGAGTSTWTWDSIGRLLTAAEPAGTVSYGYADAGPEATTITYPGNKVVTQTFDDVGRQDTTTGWVGGTTRFNYDVNSNLTGIDTGTQGVDEDVFTYDRVDRLTAVDLNKGTNPLAHLGYTRDPEGMVDVTSGDIAGAADDFGYGGFDMLTSDSDGTYSYDTADNLTGFPDGRRQQFDDLNNELCYQSPTTNTPACGSAPADATTFGYDGRGNRTSEIDEDGFGRELSYDQADRLVSVEAGEVEQVPLEDMTGQAIPGDFDGDGKDDVFWYRAGAGTDHVTWGASRSGFGKEASTFTVTGTYIPAAGDFDGDGNDDIMWYAPSGTDVIWFWFGRGTQDFEQDAITITATYDPVVGDFDADGYDDIFLYLAGTGQDKILWGNAGVDDGAAFAQTLPSVNGANFDPFAGDFDGDGADDIFWYASGSEADFIWYFSPTTRGSYTTGARTVNAAYTPFAGDFDGDGYHDAVWHNLNGADFIWWGQPTRANFDGSVQKAVTIGGFMSPFAGDFDGDTRDDLFYYVPANPQTVWWGASRTAFGTDPAEIGLPAPGPTTTYTYTGDGLRRTKTAADGTVTTYTWDRSRGLPVLLAEDIAAPGTSNDKTIRYVYDPSGLVLADITTPGAGGETIRWYHHDQLGSTVALTDATGTVLSTYAYSPFGKLAASTGTATTPIGWAGEYKDTETGYVYLRARYYDPNTAQFLTRDPIEAITRSAYGYAANNPINFIDPMGLTPCSCGEQDGGGGLFDFISDHKVGIVKGVSWILAGSAIAAAPITAGGSLSTLPVWLAAGSGATAITAEALDPKPDRAQRVTLAAGATILGGGVGGAFGEGGFAVGAVISDGGLLVFDIWSSNSGASRRNELCLGGSGSW